jgi:hypothetical protein
MDENRPSVFEYIAPTEASVKIINEFRAKCAELDGFIAMNLPVSRERSLAVTKLEEVSMWGNKAIVFNQDAYPATAAE